MSVNNVEHVSDYKLHLSNYDLTSMACEQFEKLEALFKSIRKSESHEIKKLASLGAHLCQDWGGIYDCEHEAIKHRQQENKPTNSELPLNNKNQQVPVNVEALCAALCELLTMNSFIADTSRVLQQRDLMNDERIVTERYASDLAAAIENAARKELELLEVIEQAIGVKINYSEHMPTSIKLFDMPSDSPFYYGGYGHKGALNGE